MKKLVDQISARVMEAFEIAGFDPELGRCAVSNRPDLCQYQCNGAMAGAKLYRKAPFLIAQKVVDVLAGDPMFSKAEMVRPGFINLDVAPEYLAELMNQLENDPRKGSEMDSDPKTIVLDYGGPNVAKPLHVGHLRSAIIGESIKRIARFKGHTVIGDVHLGDWGLQIGQIITELKLRQPDLPYFDETKTEDFPEEPPFSISDLEEIYPCASKKSKTDEAYKAEAQAATAKLQEGNPGYRALWRHIINVSVSDLKRNYEKLDVSFDLWKGESDCQPFIPAMVEQMKADGHAYLSDGALVVDVQEESDTREVPPCLILKSDGAAQYETTDLATIIQREQDYHPDRIIYVVDKRQELHFVRVFRTAYKTGLVSKDGCSLEFVGFGTMNGKDGKPFKTRDGGVLRLEYLLKDVADAVYEKSKGNDTLSDEELHDVSTKVGLAAIKYGDLSNQPSKDYIFDLNRFVAFEGNTGPYIMYSMVRIKSILKKFQDANPDAVLGTILPPVGQKEADLYLTIARFGDAVDDAYAQNAPNRLCRYIYDLSNCLNQFYAERNIMKEADPAKQASYVSVIRLVLEVLEKAVDLLGFEAPERM
ncbi:MAG: arginine--tRNA ligase [Oscillospiraceae bacterium]|nr:arginine--tRNA ligase [Oscillospiraceae bacterium]